MIMVGEPIGTGSMLEGSEWTLLQCYNVLKQETKLS